MRRTLSKSGIKELNEILHNEFGVEVLSKKDFVEKVDDRLIVVNKETQFFIDDETFVPTLKLIQKNNFLKTVIVDMGAVKFVVNGADIMKPGIVEVSDDIGAGDIIVIIDVDNKKPLAIGRTLFDTKEMREQTSGKSIENLHWVGDEIWNS